jgi:DNA polymerase elongation subunit (family B)
MDLFLDIETCPDLRAGALQRCIDAVEPPGNYKKPESIAEWKAQNAEAIGREQWSRTALDPMRGGIYVIGYAIDSHTKDTIYREPTEPEGPWLEHALQKVYESVDKVGQPRSPRYIGWNLIGFDLPFIAKRCAILGIAPRLRMPVGVRFNNDYVLDLMIAWSGFKDYAKQRDVAAAMGIDLLDETDGKDLWAAVERDGVAAAAKKCASDIDVLYQIYRRMAPVFRL